MLIVVLSILFGSLVGTALAFPLGHWTYDTFFCEEHYRTC